MIEGDVGADLGHFANARLCQCAGFNYPLSTTPSPLVTPSSHWITPFMQLDSTQLKQLTRDSLLVIASSPPPPPTHTTIRYDYGFQYNLVLVVVSSARKLIVGICVLWNLLVLETADVALVHNPNTGLIGPFLLWLL